MEVMNADEIRFHLPNDFWRAAKEIEQQELCAASIAKKWQEQYDIWREAIQYGVDPEKMEIYARRAKLIRLYESGVWSGRPTPE
jgi:hypothetical protein